MSSFYENLYLKSPAALQTLAVTLMGIKTKRERFNQNGISMLELLNRTQFFSREAILEYQKNEFIKTARYAIKNTEYYSRWAKENAIHENDIRSLDDIRVFPVIDKVFLKENQNIFTSNDPALKKHQFTIYTSGTTGSPLAVTTDPVSRSKHYAFFSRLRKFYGIDKNDRRATLFGRAIIRPDQKSPPFWRMDYAQNNLLMSSYHLKEEFLKDYYSKILSFKPAEIFSYPSSIFFIADYIIRKKLPPLDAKLVMCTAENLLPSQRKIITEAFNAPVVNQYGCTEMAFFAADNSDGLLEIHPEHGICEVLIKSGHVLPHGSGSLVATGFINQSMPVIRYHIADEVDLLPAKDSGRQAIREIEGRSDDIIYRLDGSPVGRIGPIFKSITTIKYGQLVQHCDGKITISLVPTNLYLPEDGNHLIEQLKIRTGDSMEVNIQLVDHIPKNRDKKFKLVISEYRPHYAQ